MADLSDHTTSYAPQRGVLLITNADQTPDDSYAFTFASTLGAKAEIPVTLYDRSEETWGDSQHPEGPMSADDERLSDRPDLCSQIRWLNDNGVHGRGWVSTLPSISAVLTALAELDADVVVVPKDFSPHLFERVLEGKTLSDQIAEQIHRHETLEAAVFEIDENGKPMRVVA